MSADWCGELSCRSGERVLQLQVRDDVHVHEEDVGRWECVSTGVSCCFVAGLLFGGRQHLFSSGAAGCSAALALLRGWETAEVKFASGWMRP